jgi:type II secretory pathway pseudopilin PulG
MISDEPGHSKILIMQESNVMRRIKVAERTDSLRSEPFSLARLAPGGPAFTIIEMIGVLAVLAILATIILSATPRRFDIEAGNLESTNLLKYATALQNSILRTRVIPSSNNIAQAIADELGMDVKDVNINARYNQRVFVYDPTLAIGTSVGGQGYTQGILGGYLADTNNPGLFTGRPPNNPRLMMISNLGPVPLPPGVTNVLVTDPNGLTDASGLNFATLWGWTDGSVPSSGPWASWAGRGEDVKIKRIDLGSLFLHLILYNYNYPSVGRGQYAIDRLATNQTPVNSAFPQTNGVDSYYLKGTILGLLKSTSLSSTLDCEQILNRDASFGYVQDAWRSSLNLGEGVDPRAALMGDALWTTASMFMGSPYSTTALNSNNVAGGPSYITPPDVVNDAANFMVAYVNWATNGFPGALSNNVYLTQKQMINDMNRLCGASPPNNSASPTVSFTAGACTNPPPP